MGEFENFNQNHQMATTQAQIDLNTISAKHDNDITRILRPYFSFRVFFKFKKANFNKRTGDKMDTIHRYGFENKCSYKQCLHGHADHILLDKNRGLNHCIQMAESQFKGSFYKAIIYTRSVTPGGDFDITLREYDQKGNFIFNNEALIQELTAPEQNKNLYFKIETGGLIKLLENPEHAEPVPTGEEFRQLITNSLQVKHVK
jgi:hypothetical protein